MFSPGQARSRKAYTATGSVLRGIARSTRRVCLAFRARPVQARQDASPSARVSKSPPQCKLIRGLALFPGATCYCRRRKMSVILSEAKNLETDSAVTYRTCEALRFAQ